MKKLSFIKKLTIKTRWKIYRVRNRLRTIYWIARLRIEGRSGLIPVEDEIDVYENDGYMYLACGEYEKAIDNFKKVIAIAEEYYSGYEALGKTYAEMGLKEEARKNYKIALANALRDNKEENERGGYMLVAERFIDDMQKALVILEKPGDAKDL